jgi:hypothetical protein
MNVLLDIYLQITSILCFKFGAFRVVLYFARPTWAALCLGNSGMRMTEATTSPARLHTQENCENSGTVNKPIAARPR